MDPRRVLEQIGIQTGATVALVRTGLLRPDRVAAMAWAVRRWGVSVAAGYAAAARRYPGEIGLVDDDGPLTFAEIEARTNALANGLVGQGVREGSVLAIMCRNHRGLVEATVAAAKLGADVLFLNTAFSGPQLADVLAREGADVVIHDDEFSDVATAGAGRASLVTEAQLRRLVSVGARSQPRRPARVGRVVILTSGTTGTPKGANRSASPRGLDAAAAIFSKIPLRARDTTVVAAPLFHAWGLAHLTLGVSLGSTLVVHRRFDPAATLEAVAQHRARVLAVVPVMLQRILALGDDVLERFDTSSLEVIAVSGSALPGELATRVMDRFGDVLYNLYGSTEVSWATIATPADMRAAPGTAGRPPPGTTVKLLGEDGDEVGPGQAGRIFVANGMLFEGYTGGGSKEVRAGMMATGDMGRFDEAGRLFVEGREDEMIVSGGENVFPREVEDLIAAHHAVDDVAVVGVDDQEFGQRLRAFVVRRPGASLSADQVKDHVRGNLARYKVPRDVVFLEELPRNPSGKVLKRELLDAPPGDPPAVG